MRIRRRLPIWFGVVLVALAIALAVVLRQHAPPEPARLLPGADGYLYVNLKWVRRANVAGQLPDVPHEPEYQEFIQATGFQFERDLDQAAFAIHYPVKRKLQPAIPGPPRFSEVFVGRIDGERLRAYLGKISGSVTARARLLRRLAGRRCCGATTSMFPWPACRGRSSKWIRWTVHPAGMP